MKNRIIFALLLCWNLSTIEAKAQDFFNRFTLLVKEQVNALPWGHEASKAQVDDWELGLLNGASLGVAKLFRQNNLYAGLGGCYSGLYKSGAGVYGSFGLFVPVAKDVALRGEISTLRTLDPTWSNYEEASVRAVFNW